MEFYYIKLYCRDLCMHIDKISATEHKYWSYWWHGMYHSFRTWGKACNYIHVMVSSWKKYIVKFVNINYDSKIKNLHNEFSRIVIFMNKIIEYLVIIYDV